MPTVAVVEDDADLFELLRYTLEQQGHKFIGSTSGMDALHLIRREHPDLVILDIMLPDTDGLEICKQIRHDRELRHTPVIFLTARGSETDRVLGFELGGNDYVVKPFSVRELMMRVKIHLQPRTPQGDLLKSGPLELDRTRYQVRLGGKPVTLTATEFRLLEHLMSYPGQVFPRSRLLDAVWGRDRDVLERTVDVYIVRLRNKIEPAPGRPRWIHSLRGVGYTFQDRGGETSLSS